MGVAHFSFGFWPIGHWPPWHWSGQGGYLLYRGVGSTPDCVDYEAPVGVGQAGAGEAYDLAAGLVDGVEYAYGLRAVSDAGVEETNETCYGRVLWAGGVLEADRPNRLQAASRRATAGGKIAVTFTYSRLGERAAAASVQIARVSGGVADWDTPLATVALRAAGITRHDAELAAGFADGEQVRLALRAITAGGVAGGVWTLETIAADATGPADVQRLVVSMNE